MKLVLDWDGTVTVRDSLWMLLEQFGELRAGHRVRALLVGVDQDQVLAHDMNSMTGRTSTAPKGAGMSLAIVSAIRSRYCCVISG